MTTHNHENVKQGLVPVISDVAQQPSENKKRQPRKSLLSNQFAVLDDSDDENEWVETVPKNHMDSAEQILKSIDADIGWSKKDPRARLKYSKLPKEQTEYLAEKISAERKVLRAQQERYYGGDSFIGKLNPPQLPKRKGKLLQMAPQDRPKQDINTMSPQDILKSVSIPHRQHFSQVSHVGENRYVPPVGKAIPPEKNFERIRRPRTINEKPEKEVRYRILDPTKVRMTHMTHLTPKLRKLTSQIRPDKKVEGLICNEAFHWLATLKSTYKVHPKVLKNFRAKADCYVNNLDYKAPLPPPLPTLSSFFPEGKISLGLQTPLGFVYNSSLLGVISNPLNVKVGWVREEMLARASLYLSFAKQNANEEADLAKSALMRIWNKYLEGSLTRATIAYQGQTQSAMKVGGLPIDVDFGLASEEAVETVVNKAIENTQDIPSVSRFLALAVGLYTADSWVTWSSLFFLYLSDMKLPNKIDSHMRFLFEKCRSLFGSFKDFVIEKGTLLKKKFQSWDPAETFKLIKEAFSKVSFSNLMDSALFRSIWEVLSSFSLVSVFMSLGRPLEPLTLAYMVRQLSYTLNPVKGANSVDSFLGKIVNFAYNLVERISAVVRTGDWREFLGSSISLSDWKQMTDLVLFEPCLVIDRARPTLRRTFLEKKKRGEIPLTFPEPMTRYERKLRLEELSAAGGLLRNHYSADTRASLTIDATLRDLAAELRKIDLEKTNGAPRIPPCAFFIPGPPGCGKSTFVAQLHMALGRLLGYDTSPETIFHLDAKSNFPDTYHSGQWAVAMDDQDISVAPESAAVKNWVENVMFYFNSTPMNMEAADLTSKGKHWANFLTGYYTTNFPHGRLDRHTLEPGAFWRRFPYRIHLKVKPAFAVEGKNEINRSLLDLPPDVWDIELFAYDGTKANVENPFDSFPFRSIGKYATLREFMCEIGPRVRAYIEKEQSYIDKREDERLAEACTVCGLGSQWHMHITTKGLEYRPCVVAPAAASPPPPAPPVVEYQSQDMAVGAGIMFAFMMALHTPTRDKIVTAIMTLLQIAWFKLYVEAVGGWKYFLITRFLVLTPAGLERRPWPIDQDTMKKGVIALGGLYIASKVLGTLHSYMCSRRQTFVEWQSLVDDPVAAPTLFPTREHFARVPVSYTRPYSRLNTPTYTIEEFTKMLRTRLVTVHYRGSVTRGVRLNNGYVLANRHLFMSDSDKLKLNSSAGLMMNESCTVSQKHEKVSFPLLPFRIATIPNKDLVVMFVPELVPLADGYNLLAKIPVSQAAPDLSADSAFMVTDSGTYTSKIRVTSVRAAGGGYSWMSAFPTVNGDCGLPLVATFSNKFAWVGLHSMYGEGISYAEDLDVTEIQSAMELLKNQSGGLHVRDVVFDATQFGPGRTFQDLPVKSSLWVSLSNGGGCTGVVVGTVTPSVSGGMMKSGIKPTLWAEELKDELAKRDLLDAFQVPIFKGEMQGDTWVDPFTVNLDSSRNHGGDMKYWLKAIDDYLDGVDQLVGTDRVRPLSFYEALIGIPGTAVGGTNLKTSAGAPFYRSKKYIMEIDHVNKQVYLDPEVIKHYDSIVEIIKAGFSYSPLGIATMKDEVISAKKNAIRKIRVFINMPFALNLLLKQYFGPLSAFMRRHWRFFESTMGMNFSDPRVLDEVLTWFRNGKKFGDGDRAFFDTGCSTIEGLACGIAMRKLGRALEWTEDEIEMVVALVQVCVYVTLVIKNDVLIVSHRMPTGFWATLFLNSIRNSLQMRYCMYKMAEEEQLQESPKFQLTVPFRSICRLLTMGDDTVTCHLETAEWFDMVALKYQLIQIGSDLTDARKGENVLPFTPFSELQFLKRNFVFREGLWYAPLAEKTLWKMLTMRDSSTLSTVDHHAELVSNVLMEAYLHGPKTFEHFKELISRLVEKYQIKSVMLKAFSYDFYDARYKAGELKVWDPTSLADITVENNQ